MPREKATYRDNLEGILSFVREKYGDNRHVININDLIEYTGLCRRTIYKRYTNGEKYTTCENFARQISI